MKVVMVDDSEADRKLCRILLEETQGPGLEFWEESAAEGGLEVCRAVSPDCVLLDYLLPDMTGLEFLTRLRSGESPNAPQSAVVMLTGMASEQVAVEAMKAGAQDYLVKDRITSGSLSSAVAKATEKVALIYALKAERDHLAQSLAEKEVLLKEVHHRVKNNLQVIASLLRMQARNIGDPALQRALQESQNRVESMALIHEQLYGTEDVRHVDLAKHAGLLADNLFHAYSVDPGRICKHLEISSVQLGIDRAIPAGLILNELISNALKHAFPGGRKGAIWIEGGSRDGCVNFAVRDDGIGIREDLNLAGSKSLGLEIVRILVRQLRGKIEIIRGRGSEFHISFPEERRCNETVQTA